jgi:hypothetical protein
MVWASQRMRASFPHVVQQCLKLWNLALKNMLALQIGLMRSLHHVRQNSNQKDEKMGKKKHSYLFLPSKQF